MQADKIHTLLTTTQCTLDTNFSYVKKYIWHCISTNISNTTLQIFVAPSADIVRQGHPHGSRGLLPCNECYGLHHTQQHFSCHIFYVTFPMSTFTCHMNTLDITKGFLANVFSMRKKAAYCFTHDCK